MAIEISRSSALCINVLLIFYMYDLNGALCLEINFLFLLLASLSPLTVIVPFKTIYASL